jgi:hypothetical protein
LLRESELVLGDVIDGKVSPRSAREEYGVVVGDRGGVYEVDALATAQLRASRRGEGKRPMVDRGPGYDEMRQRD